MHPFDQTLSALERAQHGLVTLDQVSEDWTAATIRHRLRARRARVAPRVFANPSVAPSYEQRVLTAVLSSGAGAFASHETAAQLWNLPLPGAALLEVSTSDTRRPVASGARMHRSAVIDDDDLAANGRSRKKMRIVLDRRLPGVEERESDLEDFVVGATVRFDLPMPVAQHPVVFSGQRRRIDRAYPDDWVALEAKGFRWYKERTTFDRDALRGNELQLAGFRVLSFTSAFTDWDIACQIAEALNLPRPVHRPPLTYAAWTRSR